MESDSTDLRWLDAAARLATAALGTTGAGPTVCALVVDAGAQALVGRAVTPSRGAAQAELLALTDAEGLTDGRTLYVTMEPAAHYTTLAPVTRAIVDAGIVRVVTGMLSPDPEHAGEGLAALADAGLEVVHLEHVLSQALNEGYVSRLTRARPFVTLKIALSADGMVGHASPGAEPWLGAEAMRFVERERGAADAVMSGAARAEIEDNDLLVHLEGLGGRPHLRVVLAGSRAIDPRRDLFAVVSGVPIVVFTTPARPLAVRPGIEVAVVEDRHGHPDLRQVLVALADRGIGRLFVEAGAKLAESFIAGEMIDRLHVIDSPRSVGRGGTPAAVLGHFEDRITAARFSQVDRLRLGEDKVRTFERN